MPVQTGATIEDIPTDDLETPDYEFKGNDSGEVPLVHENTVLTDARAIHARKQSLAYSREALDEATITTKRDTIDRHEERVDDLEATTAIRIPHEAEGSKRDIIGDLVDTNVSDVDSRLLTAILFASTHDDVTDITACDKFVMFDLDADTHIEATALGDGIVIQGRGKHYGHEVARSFPETCLQENEVLNTIREMLAPENGWAIF